MAIEIQGIDKLISKLNKISNIEARAVLNDAAKEIETSIVNQAKTFSDSEYKHIGQCEVRNYGSSCFIDVGLRNDHVDFNEWKGLWYHNWGYTHWKSGKQVTPHIMWFENAVNSVSNDVTNKIKNKVKQELKNFND